MPEEQRIGIVIEGQDRVSGELRKVAQGFRMTEQEYRKFLASLKPEKMKEMSAATGMSTEKLKQWAAGATRAEAAGRGVATQAGKTTGALKILGGVAGVVGFSVMASRLGAVRRSLVDADVQSQKYAARLSTLTGSTAAGNRVLAEMHDVMRKTTTLDLEGLVQARVVMQALGLAARDSAERFRIIAAAAEVLNRPMEALMQSLARVTAQIEAGKAPDVRMVQRLGITRQELEKLAAGAPITAATVFQAMSKMETGTAKLAKTTAGALDDMDDAWLELREKLGESLRPITEGVARTATTIVDKLGKASPAAQSLLALGVAGAEGGSRAAAGITAIGTAAIALKMTGALDALGRAGTLLMALKTMGRISVVVGLSIAAGEAVWQILDLLAGRSMRRMEIEGRPVGPQMPGGIDVRRFGGTVAGGFREGGPGRMSPAQERADINRLLGVTTKGIHPEGAIQRLSRAWAAEFAKDYSGRIQAFLDALGPGRGFRATSVVRPWGGHARWKKVDVVPTGKTSWAELTAAAEAADFHVSREVKPSERSARATGAHLDLALLTPEARAAIGWREGMAKDAQAAADKARKEGEKAREEQAAHLERLSQARRELQKSLMEPMEAAIADLNDQAREWKQQGIPKGEQRAAYDAEWQRIHDEFVSGIEGSTNLWADLSARVKQAMTEAIARGEGVWTEVTGFDPSTYQPGAIAKTTGVYEGARQRKAFEDAEDEQRKTIEDTTQAMERWQQSFESWNLSLADALLQGPKGLAGWLQSQARGVMTEIVSQALGTFRGGASAFGRLNEAVGTGLPRDLDMLPMAMARATGGTFTGSIGAELARVMGLIPKVGPPSDPKSQSKAVKEGVQAAAGAMGAGIPGRTVSRGTATTMAALSVGAAMTGNPVIEGAVSMGMAAFTASKGNWYIAIAGMILGGILGNSAKKKANEQAKARQWLNAPEEFEIQAYLYNLGRMGAGRTSIWAGATQRDPLIRTDSITINVNGAGDPAATARAVSAELQALTMSAGAYGGEYD